MTTLEKFKDTLKKNGCLDSHIEEICKSVLPKVQSFVENTTGHLLAWNLPHDGYPKIVNDLIFIQAKPHILKWYDKNAPEAWNRMMFLPSDEIKALLKF